MTYRNPRVRLKHRFVSTAPIDWASYENRKIDALQKKEVNIKALKQINQRDFLISLLYQSGYTEPQLEKLFEMGGLPTPHSVVSDSLKRYKKKFNPTWLKMLELEPKRPKGWQTLSSVGV